jgi:hypothetical protein
MLGKRLVDYSDDESAGENTVQLGEQQAPAELGQPAKKKIAYSKLPNPLKSLLQVETISKIQEEAAHLQPAQGKQREISFDTVRGGRKLLLDAPREKVWKGSKKEREPFYYTAFKEIYKAEIDKTLQSEAPGRAQPVSGEPVAATELVDGQAVPVRDVTQAQLVQFDYAKYRELNERKELLLEDRVQQLRRGAVDSNLDRLKARALELLEREAAAEVQGVKEEGLRRNKKQYGF